MSYPIERVARALSDDALVAVLNAKNAEADDWFSAGYNPEREDDLRSLVVVRDALRAEFRRRTGEVV